MQAWAPPPPSGVSGGDVAGLVLVGEGLPGRAGPAQLTDPATVRDVTAGVFGYPGDPPRQVNGAWSELRLRGAVGGGVIQLDTGSESAICAQPGYSGSPVIVTGDVGDAVLGMLAVTSRESEARDAYAIPVPELARAWPDVVGRLTIPARPYRGLGAFTADDAAVFVGREDEVSRLREMVRRQPLVVVTGPSGVGKSSLVNAGLIPLLRDEGWAAGSFRPGGVPVDALATALAAVQAPGRPPTVAEVGEWAALVRSDGLASVGSQLALTLGHPVLLHADQLEEILDPAACPQDLKAEFLEVLLSAQAAPEDGLHLVGTLRADFWAQLLEHPDAGVRLDDRWFGLSPMGRDLLERVIAEPARARDVRYQDGLVGVVAGDAGGGRGLPLLEFALTQLWPHQEGRQITLAAYRGIGGVTGALSRHAEQTYQDLLGQFSQERIRRVMLALVRSRRGAAEATRRVVSRERLGEDWEVAQALARQRLLSTDRDPGKGEETAEIAHEALIREWPTFASWVNDDADFQHWLTSAEERAADGELLPDTRLTEANRWLAERAADVPHEVKQLVKDSKAELLLRITELENARNRAEQAAREAEARRLAAAAELGLTSRETPLQIPIALAVESLRTARVLEADIATRHAIRTAARQIRRFDHDSSVNAVAYSPDGTRIATGSGDLPGRKCSARVFDAATGTEISRLDHDSPVSAVAFSPDGTRVATGSADRSARVFDAATGTEISRLDHDSRVNAVAFSPDGTRVATGSSGDDLGRGGSARVFDAATGTEISRLDHDSPVSAVAFSPDGTRVATGSSGELLGRRCSARVFDAATGTEISRLDHDGSVNAVAYSPDGTRVATASADLPGRSGSARVFDAATGTEISRLDHDSPVSVVAFSPDGTRVATGSGDLSGRSGSARVFDAATGTEISRLDHDGSVNAVAFSPDGTRVATGSADRSARVFDAATGAEISRLDHDGSVNAVAYSPDGTRVATGSSGELLGSSGSARVFDAATGTEISRLDHDGSVNAVAYSPDGTRVATASADLPGRSGSARVFDAATGTEISRLDHDSPVSAVAYSPDGTRVATGSGDLPGRSGSARVFDAATGTEISRLDHDSPVSAVAYSPDGTRVATGSSGELLGSSGSARVFDAATGTEISRLDHDSSVNAVAYSPDGTRVATASGDLPGRRCSARVFDAATGTEISRLDHDSPVSAVAYSPDGTRVATGSGDDLGRRCSARVFDAATGTEISRLDHDSSVNAVAYSPDGTRVATASGDLSGRSVRVWCVDHGQLIEQAVGRLTRNLTRQEWRRYFRDEPYRKTRADLP